MNKPTFTPQELANHVRMFARSAHRRAGKATLYLAADRLESQEKLLGEIEMFVTEVERFADNNSYLRLIKDSQEMLEMLKTRNEVK